MLYNTALRPSKKKPNEEEVQQAKILAYYPAHEAAEEKRNRVGILEGTILFCQCSIQAENSPYAIIRTAGVDYVLKSAQPDCWLFLAVKRRVPGGQSTTGTKYLQTGSYREEVFTDEQLLSIADKLCKIVRVFVGSLLAFQSQQSKSRLSNIVAELVPRFLFGCLNERLQTTIDPFTFEAVRILPQQPSVALKLYMLEQIAKELDPDIVGSQCFLGGLQCYSSLPPQASAFFCSYMLGTGQALRFNENKLINMVKLKSIESQPSVKSNSFCYYVRLNELAQEVCTDFSFPLVDLAPFGLPKCALLVWAEKGLIYLVFAKSAEGVKKSAVVLELLALLNEHLERLRPQLGQSLRRVQNQEQYYNFVYVNEHMCAGKRTMDSTPQRVARLRQHRLVWLQSGKENLVARRGFGRYYVMRDHVKPDSKFKEEVQQFQKIYFSANYF